jgi:hypothetical protein
MTSDQGQAQNLEARWRRELYGARHAVVWQFYLFYCRWFYQAHMRWLHKRDRHKWEHFVIEGGPEFDKCQWCGAERRPNEVGGYYPWDCRKGVC